MHNALRIDKILILDHFYICIDNHLQALQTNKIYSATKEDSYFSVNKDVLPKTSSSLFPGFDEVFMSLIFLLNNEYWYRLPQS